MPRFQLDPDNDSFSEKFLFWAAKYVKNKATTLSTRLLKDQRMFELCIDKLQKLPQDISELSEIVKDLRKAGMEGVKSFYIPVEKFYEYATSRNLEMMTDIDEEFVIDFLTTNTHSHSDATKKNYKNTIVNFLNYISKNNEQVAGSGLGYIYNIELKNWQGLGGKRGNKMPAYMKESELDKVIEALDAFPFPSDRTAALYTLIIKIFAYTGMRVNEVLTLQSKDIFEQGDLVQFQVRGKGNKARTASVLKELILTDLQRWKQISGCQTTLLFCGERDKSKQLRETTVSIFVGKLLRFAGIKKSKNGAHLFRHTFATIVYQKTKDLALTQDSLGHEDPATTRIYAHIDAEEKKKVANVFSRPK